VKAFLDTHAVAMMGRGERDVFGAKALDVIDRCALYYAPIVTLELHFLHEIGRITEDVGVLLRTLEASYGVVQSDESTAAVVEQAARLTWTRDPFDRLIVATAVLHRAPLVTKDATITAQYREAVW